MGTLYYSSGSIAAVFEDGVVYYDSLKTTILGTYEGNTIYSGSGLYKRSIGSYSGGVIYDFYNPAGHISGETVYLGSSSLFNNARVGYYYGDDDFGAAAAALIVGMLKEFSFDTDINDINTTNYDYDYDVQPGPGGGYTGNETIGKVIGVGGVLLGSIIVIGIALLTLWIVYKEAVETIAAGPQDSEYNDMIALLVTFGIGGIIGAYIYNENEKFFANYGTIYFTTTIIVAVLNIIYCAIFENYGILELVVAPTIVCMCLNISVSFIATLIGKLDSVLNRLV